MQLTIQLPDDVGRRLRGLPDPESFVREAIARALSTLRQAEMPASPSRWARLVERVEADPVHLDGYGEQIKRDIRQVRDELAFQHDSE